MWPMNCWSDWKLFPAPKKLHQLTIFICQFSSAGSGSFNLTKIASFFLSRGSFSLPPALVMGRDGGGILLQPPCPWCSLSSRSATGCPFFFFFLDTHFTTFFGFFTTKVTLCLLAYSPTAVFSVFFPLLLISSLFVPPLFPFFPFPLLPLPPFILPSFFL